MTLTYFDDDQKGRSMFLCVLISMIIIQGVTILILNQKLKRSANNYAGYIAG